MLSFSSWSVAGNGWVCESLKGDYDDFLALQNMALDPQYKDQQEVWLNDNSVMNKFKRINRFINGGVKYVPWSHVSYSTTRLPMLAAERYDEPLFLHLLSFMYLSSLSYHHDLMLFRF